MTSFSGPLPYRIKQPYEMLLSELEDLAAKSDCGPTKVIGRFKKSEGVENSYAFDCHFHLQRWKERGTSSKERIHIVVRVQETIKKQEADFLLTHSTVNVSYFKVDDQTARLLHTVHYDHCGPEKSHPIFHAQLSREAIELAAEDANELEFELPQAQCEPIFKNARIPTCDMTFPSVVLCLAADHTNLDFFGEFLARVQELQEKMPKPAFSETKASLQLEPHHLRSSHWFAHSL